MRPAVSKMPTKKSFFSLMKGDIAQRSIRSSMSRIVDARLPRMISRVTDRRGGVSHDCAPADVVGGVHARTESWSHQRRRVVLGDDGGPSKLIPAPGHSSRSRAWPRSPCPGSRPGADRSWRGSPLRPARPAPCAGARPDGGDAEVDELDGRVGQGIRVEASVLGVEGRGQLRETGRGHRPSRGAGQLEALVLVAEIGRPLEALPVARISSVSSQARACASSSPHVASSGFTSTPRAAAGPSPR